MYYLNNRYYNPLLCRFITPDNNEYIDKENAKSFNLYAYCYNDPVNYSDPEGTMPEWLATLLGGIVGSIIIPGAVGTVLGALTGNDAYQATQMTVETNNNNITIKDSWMIKTPWAQFAYSMYLKYSYDETKGKIKGSALGAQFEWMCHNVVYYGLTTFKEVTRIEFPNYIEQARSVDIGPTIYNDNHGSESFAMLGGYILLFRYVASVDLLYYLIGGIKK